MDPAPGTTEQIDMDAFRREIEELKRTDADIHLPGVTPDALTEFDAQTWNLYKSGKLSISEFKSRRYEAVGLLKTEDPRTLFYAFIGNDWYDRHGQPQI